MAKRSPPERNDINKRMMTAIREQDITQADLVRATGATSPTVTDWFNKGAVPDAATLARVAKHLRLNGHWLLTGQGSPLAPGEGETPTDVAFALGARAVITELRRILSTLEVAYFGDRATSLDEAALAAMKVLERTGVLHQQKRRQVR